VTVVPVDYQSTEQYGTGEFDMDSQSSTGIAGDVKGLYFYNMGELYESEIVQAFSHWVTDDVAQVASASFGECEFQAALDGGMIAEDSVLTQAVVQGQTLFSSAGDEGSTCGLTIITNGVVPAVGPPQAEYPAASPWVMGVGGTTLFPHPDATYGQEIAWYAGGGGVSFFEGPPFWTNGASPGMVPVWSSIGGPGIVPLAGYQSGRTVPDVSMDADAQISPISCYFGGSIGGNGGTSLSSPLAAGVFARLQSRHNNQLGNAGPALYGNYLAFGGGLGAVNKPANGSVDADVAGFHDVLAGANGDYQATPGYDMVTGMGSLNINRLIIFFGS
jgi:subtilase family serine protease